MSKWPFCAIGTRLNTVCILIDEASILEDEKFITWSDNTKFAVWIVNVFAVRKYIRPNANTIIPATWIILIYSMESGDRRTRADQEF